MDKTNDAGFIRVVETMNVLDVLAALLRSPREITAVKSQEFRAGWRTSDEVIVSHRFLVIRRGAMDYTVEGRRTRLAAGTQFFVPAWCRREWRSVRGCDLVWCEFSSGAVAVPPVLCRREPPESAREPEAFGRMHAWWNDDADERGRLLAEGELAAALARFWVDAEVVGAGGGPRESRHPEVARATAWLERHYAAPDALETFYGTLGLSPNHFRLLFRRQTGETVQGVLARLRLRRARYLVRETSMPMKRIAAETGFADPLYFSNQYKRFWGRRASEDRAAGGVA